MNIIPSQLRELRMSAQSTKWFTFEFFVHPRSQRFWRHPFLIKKNECWTVPACERKQRRLEKTYFETMELCKWCLFLFSIDTHTNFFRRSHNENRHYSHSRSSIATFEFLESVNVVENVHTKNSSYFFFLLCRRSQRHYESEQYKETKTGQVKPNAFVSVCMLDRTVGIRWSSTTPICVSGTIFKLNFTLFTTHWKRMTCKLVPLTARTAPNRIYFNRWQEHHAAPQAVRNMRQWRRRLRRRRKNSNS